MNGKNGSCVNQPFSGLRIVDLTQVLAGPFASYQLALLGADVIKVEAPRRPDPARARGADRARAAAGLGLTYQVQGANKRAITLDLRQPEGRDLLLRLVAGADVLIENFSGGTLDALGVGADALLATKSDLIYCHISGFGAAGSRATTHAYDNVIQAASGMIDQCGGRKPGLSMVDYAAGWNAAFAISAALHARRADGLSRRIEVSMLEAALLMMAPEAVGAGEQPAADVREAGLRRFDTADGVLMLGVFTPEQNRRLWAALGEDRADAAGFGAIDGWEDLWREADAMAAALTRIFARRTAAAWEAWLHEHGLPGERVRTLAQGVALARRQRLGFYVPCDGVDLPLAAFTIDHGGPAIGVPPPAHGADTDTVLRELGCDDARIAMLRERGCV